MKLKIGLTGSIGMGKSTTAQMFADAGCVLWDADAAVHRLYAKGGAAIRPMSALYPDAIEDGAVSRTRLREIIARDRTALTRIEAAVHPLVREDRSIFAARHPDQIGIFDIPLLYETGSESEMDVVVCVSIPADLQRERVLARNTMSAEDLDTILGRQMPNDEKCARANHVIVTDTLDHARSQVHSVLRQIKEKFGHA